MNLHEYQSKALFKAHGLPVGQGQLCRRVEDVAGVVAELGSDRWVCKVQVHAGGRGKAGGVKVVENVADLESFARRWLGSRLVTAQTDVEGQPVDVVYIENAVSIDRELYLGVLIDRSAESVVVMGSTEGGVEIEKVAAETPEKIHRVEIDPLLGPQLWQGRSLGYQLGFLGTQNRAFCNLFMNLCSLFKSVDGSLVEINPLVVTEQGELLCLDAKVAIDSNASFRQRELFALSDTRQIDAREAEAAKFGLNYVALDGNIGCMVNGAGLAMGTMDTVKLFGGSPANFLDVGGGVNAEAVSEAFRIILSDASVKSILINIFGGIVSCETIAEGIVAAVRTVGVSVPIVVRFDGNHAREGGALLEQSGLKIRSVPQLPDAARSAVEAASAAA